MLSLPIKASYFHVENNHLTIRNASVVGKPKVYAIVGLSQVPPERMIRLIKPHTAPTTAPKVHFFIASSYITFIANIH